MKSEKALKAELNRVFKTLDDLAEGDFEAEQEIVELAVDYGIACVCHNTTALNAILGRAYALQVRLEDESGPEPEVEIGMGHPEKDYGAPEYESFEDRRQRLHDLMDD